MSFFGHDEPLGMPKGSVRALLVVGMLLIIAGVQFSGIALLGVVEKAYLMGMGFYVGYRVAKDGNGGG